LQSVLNKSVIFFAHQIAFLHIQNVTEFTVDEKNLNMKMTENIIIFQVFF